mmetsp:Transcript_5377/g.24831  ORF Transcript_5377/g.24831 Transcript_5377/m.24831 type:complete len:294 (+) Transcript_5377:1296-2177(+)
MNFLTPLARPRTPTRYTPPGMFSGGRHRSVSLLLRPKGPAGRYSTYVLKSSSVATTSHSASDDSPPASSRLNRSTTMYVPNGGGRAWRLGLAHRNVAEASSRPAVTLRIAPLASGPTFESKTSPKRLHRGQRRSTGGTRAWIPSRGARSNRGWSAAAGDAPEPVCVESFAIESRVNSESFAAESRVKSRVNSHRHSAYAPSVFGPYRVLAPSYLCAAYSSGVVTYPLYPLARPVTMTSQSSVAPPPAASAAVALIHRTSRAPAAVVTSAGTHATSRVPTRSTCTGTSTATHAS